MAFSILLRAVHAARMVVYRNAWRGGAWRGRFVWWGVSSARDMRQAKEEQGTIARAWCLKRALASFLIASWGRIAAEGGGRMGGAGSEEGEGFT
jgi:hypothetical protein